MGQPHQSTSFHIYFIQVSLHSMLTPRTESYVADSTKMHDSTLLSAIVLLTLVFGSSITAAASQCETPPMFIRAEGPRQEQHRWHAHRDDGADVLVKVVQPCWPIPCVYGPVT